MRSVLTLIPLVALACTSPRPSQAPSSSIAPEIGTAAWKRLETSLPGTWTMASPKGPFVVSYRLISNGSAIVETWGVGSGRETMTVFHRDHDEARLTHYCAQGNQPRLRAVSATADTVVFRFVDATNVGPDQGVLVERTLRFGDGVLDDTEIYREPDGKRDETTYHFRRDVAASP